jgi:Outer membrane protein beta-barrel domain
LACEWAYFLNVKIPLMKKLVVLVLTAGAFYTASAQVQFGVKAGANFATLSGSGSDGAKTKVGFNGGAFAHIPITNSFFLQPELVYSGQGAKATSDGMDFNVNQNYLNIPVLVKYHHESGLFAETGPQLGFLLSANVNAGGTSQDVKSSYKSTDFSWAFGLGYMLSSMPVGIDARYNLGLTNIAAQAPSDQSVRNSVFQVGLFYMFGGKE